MGIVFDTRVTWGGAKFVEGATVVDAGTIFRTRVTWEGALFLW